MTKDEIEFREKRMVWNKHVLGAHCAYMNFVLDMQKVSGMSYEDAETELMAWYAKGIPFQETIDAYAYDVSPEPLSNELSLEA